MKEFGPKTLHLMLNNLKMLPSKKDRWLWPAGWINMTDYIDPFATQLDENFYGKVCMYHPMLKFLPPKMAKQMDEQD